MESAALDLSLLLEAQKVYFQYVSYTRFMFSSAAWSAEFDSVVWDWKIELSSGRLEKDPDDGKSLESFDGD